MEYTFYKKQPNSSYKDKNVQLKKKKAHTNSVVLSNNFTYLLILMTVLGVQLANSAMLLERNSHLGERN